MKAKAFILNRLFDKRQREIIWNAVLFSEHTYRRRGDVDSAAQVQQVINEVATIFGVKETFTRQEVDEIMKRTGQQVADDIQKVVVARNFRKPTRMVARQALRRHWTS